MLNLTCSRDTSDSASVPAFCNPLRTRRRRRAREWEQWAHTEFAHAKLGDARRTKRLVAIASHLALHPSAFVTQVFATDRKAMNAAYDFLENDAVAPQQIFEAHFAATAARCAQHRFVFVPVDGSSLHFDDADGERGMGRIGRDSAGAKGLKTMTALAVSPDGIVQGTLGVSLWARAPEKSKPSRSRRIDDMETRYWHQTIEQARTSLELHGGTCLMWLQMDREADSWSLLIKALELDAEAGHLTTIRASTSRLLARDPDGQDETEPGGKLFDALERSELQATYEMPVLAGPNRKERSAHMTLKWQEVTLLLENRRSRKKIPAPVFAVLAEESGTCPEGEKPLRWLLLTTYNVQSVNDALLVVNGYSQRWKIETYHAALKTRGSDVESSQLQERSHVERWLAIQTAVAVRTLRLTQLARAKEERLASEELSVVECEALLVRFDHEPEQAAELTCRVAVQWIASLGGHVGNPNKRPIGFIVLTRGLKELRTMTAMYERMKK